MSLSGATQCHQTFTMEGLSCAIQREQNSKGVLFNWWKCMVTTKLFSLLSPSAAFCTATLMVICPSFSG